MELTWIEDFLALARLRHFTQAAGERHATQPAFSRRIRQLEAWVGADLVNRETRPLTLTPSGEEFLRRAQTVRADLLDARRAALSLNSHYAATRRIVTTNAIAAAFLPHWMEGRAEGPYSLQVASVTGCVEAVRQGRADIGLIAVFKDDDVAEGLTQETVGTDVLRLYASPALDKQMVLNRRRLNGPLMVYAPGTAYGKHVSDMLARHQVELADEPVCESSAAEALVALTKAGHGAAWLPEMLADDELERCSVPAFFDVKYRIVRINR